MASEELIVESSPVERLLVFLHNAGSKERYNEIREIFNANLDITDLLARTTSLFEEVKEEFRRATSSNRLVIDSKEYVHINDLTTGGICSNRMTKRYLSFPSNVKCRRRCKVHKGFRCRLLVDEVAFICFLYMKVYSDKVTESFEETMWLDESNVRIGGSEEEVEIKESLELDSEAEHLNAVDVAEFKARTIVEENIESLHEIQKEMSLPCLPSFSINNKDFVLLSDIQMMFSLREDYCLALIAQFSDVEKDWVDFKSDFGYLDTDTDNFVDAPKALSILLKEAKEYEEKGLPTEEECSAIQERLGISNIGRERAASKEKAENTDEGKESIDLWERTVLVNDENIKIFTICLQSKLNGGNSSNAIIFNMYKFGIDIQKYFW